MNTKVTIDEVAKLCNVSKTTISRCLNGHFEYMSQETKDKIEETIKKLNYRPNNLARSLKSNKSGLIGAVIADITSPFSSILVKGIGDVCQKNGYQVIIANTDNDAAKEKDYIRSLIDNRVEGIIINSTGKNNGYLIELKEQGLPIVLADRSMNEPIFDTVTSDNYSMTVKTIKYLIDSGFNKIAFFSEQIGENSARYIRHKAFLDACSSYLNIDASKYVYIINSSDNESVSNSLKNFIENNSDNHKAIFAVNGVVLLSVLQNIIKLNYNIPKDTAVCGYDNWGWASLIPPGITVISQPSYDVGVEAAKMLISRINNKNKKPAMLELPSTLTKRGSTMLK